MPRLRNKIIETHKQREGARDSSLMPSFCFCFTAGQNGLAGASILQMAAQLLFRTLALGCRRVSKRLMKYDLCSTYISMNGQTVVAASYILQGLCKTKLDIEAADKASASFLPHRPPLLPVSLIRSFFICRHNARLYLQSICTRILPQNMSGGRACPSRETGHNSQGPNWNLARLEQVPEILRPIPCHGGGF